MILKEQITVDIDSGRLNNYPCIVVSSTGQKFIFYEKYLTTGKQSYSRITFTAPSFIINVEAGNGIINGVPVSWNAGSLIATPNSYQLVYVTISGVLGIKTNPTIYDIQNVIILAFVSVGASSITRIEEVEQTGYYIYVRKQSLVGSDWVWDDYEYRLNTGQQPRAFYNKNDDKVYLSYLKDGRSYVRVFNPTNELTWEYLSNVYITTGTINLNNDPSNTLMLTVSSGRKSVIDIYDDLYPMTTFDFTFINNSVYVFIPYLTGNYLRYINSILTFEIGHFQGENFIVEKTYQTQFILHSFSYIPWEYSLGWKYIRVRLYTKLFNYEYITYPINYKSVELFEYPAKIVDNGSGYDVTAKDNMVSVSVSSGYSASLTKTIEYIESKMFLSDNLNCSISSGYTVSLTKTMEYIEDRRFLSDSISVTISSGRCVFLQIIS